jgi:hypothetical protein
MLVTCEQVCETHFGDTLWALVCLAGGLLQNTYRYLVLHHLL